jgi:predicted nuclease with RNAse H fold
LTTYIGIDVQTRRRPCYAMLSETAVLTTSGWARTPVVESLVSTVQAEAQRGEVVVGIDSPSRALTAGRQWTWRRRASWQAIGPGPPRIGRHCEVVLKALGLANPQWTPLAAGVPDWMRIGIALFDGLQVLGPPHQVLEVFPTASYRQLVGRPEPALTINLSAFSAGPKDMLDACVAALTVREFHQGRGCQVGGGDHLGTIVLPRPVDQGHPVHQWPGLGHTV